MKKLLLFIFKKFHVTETARMSSLWICKYLKYDYNLKKNPIWEGKLLREQFLVYSVLYLCKINSFLRLFLFQILDIFSEQTHWVGRSLFSCRTTWTLLSVCSCVRVRIKTRGPWCFTLGAGRTSQFSDCHVNTPIDKE